MPRNHPAVGIVAVLALVLGVLTAPSAVAEDAGDRVHLTGTVTTADGAPVAGLYFELTGPGVNTQAPPSATTRADGAYDISVAPGTCRIYGERTYDPIAEPVPGVLPAYALSEEGPLDLTVDRVLDIVLPALVPVSVRVVGDDGAPIPGARVTLGSYGTAGGDVPFTVTAESQSIDAYVDLDGTAHLDVFDCGCTLTGRWRFGSNPDTSTPTSRST